MTTSHENGINNKKPRTPPKNLATERSGAFALKASAFSDRLRGFGVDDQLRAIHAAIDQINTHLSTLPEDYKPKRGAGAGRILAPGRIYAIKPKYIERYEKIAGPGNATACIYDKDIDDKDALCKLATADGEVTLQMPKNHLAKEIN